MTSTYYKVYIDLTGKPAGNTGQGFRIFDQEVKTFKTATEVSQYMSENYQGKSRVKMYRDNKQGESEHIGYIYKMGLQRDWSHADPSQWYEQHWIEIVRIVESPIINIRMKGNQ